MLSALPPLGSTNAQYLDPVTRRQFVPDPEQRNRPRLRVSRRQRRHCGTRRRYSAAALSGSSSICLRDDHGSIDGFISAVVPAPDQHAAIVRPQCALNVVQSRRRAWHMGRSPSAASHPGCWTSRAAAPPGFRRPGSRCHRCARTPLVTKGRCQGVTACHPEAGRVDLDHTPFVRARNDRFRHRSAARAAGHASSGRG